MSSYIPLNLRDLPAWTGALSSPEAGFTNTLIEYSNFNFRSIKNIIDDINSNLLDLNSNTTLKERLDQISVWSVDDEKWYVNNNALQNINIDKIVDSTSYVKMTMEEREYLSSVLDGSLSQFQLQVGNNTPLTGTTKLMSGDTISISQFLYGEKPAIKIKSKVPLDYYRKSFYSVQPSKVDVNNNYHYKVHDDAYIYGTLRVYVNTHRIPDELIDQNLSYTGEFKFKSTIPLSELPDIPSGDSLRVDFDVPFVLNPEDVQSVSSGKWWAFIDLPTGDTLEASEALDNLIFNSTDGTIIIQGINPDIIDFRINTTMIDHDLLLNYEPDRHHILHADDQYIWSTIGIERDNTPTSIPINGSSSIEPSTLDFNNLLTLRYQDGLLIKSDNSDKSVTFGVDIDYVRGLNVLITGDIINQDYFTESEFLETRTHYFDFRFNMRREVSSDEDDYGILWTRGQEPADNIWAIGLKTKQTFEQVYIDNLLQFRTNGQIDDSSLDSKEMIISQRFYPINGTLSIDIGKFVGIATNNATELGHIKHVDVENMAVDTFDPSNKTPLHIIGLVIDKDDSRGYVDVALENSVVKITRINVSGTGSTSSGDTLYFSNVSGDEGTLIDNTISIDNTYIGYHIKAGSVFLYNGTAAKYFRINFSNPIYMTEEIDIT